MGKINLGNKGLTKLWNISPDNLGSFNIKLKFYRYNIQKRIFKHLLQKIHCITNYRSMLLKIYSFFLTRRCKIS